MSNLRFWWHEGVAEAGAAPDQVRADGETQTNPDFIFSFPSFPPFPPFLAHLELPPRLFPRRRHLAPGLFFPSLFGSAPSSRTNAAPINNRGSCSLPLPPSDPSSFLLVCPFSCREETPENPGVGVELIHVPLIPGIGSIRSTWGDF